MNKTSKLIQNIPKDISHLDSLGHKLISLDLNIKNPEYTDKIYRNRKLMIGELSKVHRMGQPIKEVVYTDIEHGTWRTVLGRLKLHQKNVMCSAYLQQMNVLNQNLNFSEAIPKMNDLSDFLKSRTGFQIKPVSGMIDARKFLNCLAFKVFCAGQFIRHHESIEFTPEPDVVHEYVGHVPMFAEPAIAKISQKIGELSLGASDENIKKLGFAYLCTLELGLIKENGVKKAYGAAIAPCIADLKRMQSGEYPWNYFDPFTKFEIQEMNYQKPFESFYLCESFEQAFERLLKFGESMIQASKQTFVL